MFWMTDKRIDELKRDYQDLRTAFLAMRDQVDVLSYQLKSADLEPIRTYHGDSTIWRAAVSPDVSVRNVVLALVDELGYQVGWDRGKAARVTLDPKSKK